MGRKNKLNFYLFGNTCTLVFDVNEVNCNNFMENTSSIDLNLNVPKHIKSI